MALIVQKYGGTSVRDVERIRSVATRIQSFHEQGHQVVVVVVEHVGHLFGRPDVERPLLAPAPGTAQEAGRLASQSLRPFRFLFYAYAIAWILVFGWIVAVARRLSKLDSRLRD